MVPGEQQAGAVGSGSGTGCKLDTVESVVERKTLKQLLSNLVTLAILTTLPTPSTRYWTISGAPPQTDSAALPRGQIEELFPARCRNTIQHLRLTETHGPSGSDTLASLLSLLHISNIAHSVNIHVFAEDAAGTKKFLISGMNRSISILF